MSNYTTFATIKTEGESILVKSNLSQDDFLHRVNDIIVGNSQDFIFVALDGNPLMISRNRLENAVILTTDYVY